MVDVEADGPIPERYSMVAIGVVVVEPGLQRTFYGRLRPISEQFIPTALSVSGFSRPDTLAFPNPGDVIRDLSRGRSPPSLGRLGRPMWAIRS